jgi:hypothetical protein
MASAIDLVCHLFLAWLEVRVDMEVEGLADMAVLG